MTELMFFLHSLQHAANSLLFVLSPSLVVSHTHGLLATFISGASLSSSAMIEMLCWLALCISFGSSISSHRSHLVSLLISFIPPHLIYLVLSHLVSLCLCPIIFAPSYLLHSPDLFNHQLQPWLLYTISLSQRILQVFKFVTCWAREWASILYRNSVRWACILKLLSIFG